MGTVAVATRTLAELEATIERGLATFVEVGQALAEVRERKLYTDRYDTFEVYCRERWGLKRQRAYELMDAAEVVEQMSEISDILPARESHAAELTILKDDPAGMVEAYADAIEQSGGQPTAADVHDAVDRKLGRPSRPPREKRSVSSAAERADFADAPEDAAALGFEDAPAVDAEVVNNEPKTHGAPERFCSACGDRYRGDACPCATAAEPEPAAATYQPAPRTSSVSVGRQPIAPTRAPSGPAPLTIQGDAGDAMRAVADRWSLDRVAEGIGETYSEAERRSLVIQLIDALPTPLLDPVRHRLDVRTKAQTSAPATFADIDQAIAAHLTTEQQTALVARTLNRWDAAAQRKLFEMLAGRFSLAVAG